MDANLIARLIISIIAIINMVAAQNGWSPVEADEQDIYLTVSTVVAIICWIRGFWKNNNFTEAAKLGQMVLDEIKLDQKQAELEEKRKYINSVVTINKKETEENENE